MKSRASWELWTEASLIQKSKLYRRIFVSSLLSMRRCALQRWHCAPPGIARSLRPANHVKTIESLEFTLKPNAKIIQKFKTFNNKRNKSVYDVAGAISDQELDSMIGLASELKQNTIAWLREVHPKLIEG